MEPPVLTILWGVRGDVNQRTFQFRKDNIHFGKHPGNDICTSGYSMRVSRNHAAMNWDGEKWVISDLNSLYGTYVNGQRVDGNTALGVKSGDIIRIGDIELEVSY